MADGIGIRRPILWDGRVGWFFWGGVGQVRRRRRMGSVARARRERVAGSGMLENWVSWLAEFWLSARLMSAPMPRRRNVAPEGMLKICWVPGGT